MYIVTITLSHGSYFQIKV